MQRAHLALLAGAALLTACPDPETKQTPTTTMVDQTRVEPASSLALSDVGSGVVAIDYDNDGDEDLFVATGYSLAQTDKKSLVLLKNDGAGGFTDVSQQAGIAGPKRYYSDVYGFDYDNDGDQDVLATASESTDGQLSNDGNAVLFKNNGDGTFTDVTEMSGIDNGASVVSTSIGDYDGDGLLDVFFCNYGDTDVVYGLPPDMRAFAAAPDTLFRNNGNGTFTNVAPRVGLNGFADRLCMASVFLDYDGDGDSDLLLGHDYVLEDYSELDGYLTLWRNDGGRFTDASAESGLLNLGRGGWMGFAVMDLDGDGDLDVVADNLGTSYYTVPPTGTNGAPFNPYAAALIVDNGTFTDIAAQISLTGVPPISSWDGAPLPGPPQGLQQLPWGWGISSFDYDNDGNEDLYQTGSWGVTSTVGIIGTPERGASWGVLARRVAPLGFQDITKEAGVANVRSDGFILPSWGHTAADLNNDGFLDIVVGNMKMKDIPGSIRVFMNQKNANHWLKVKLVGGKGSNRDGLGAIVYVTVKGRVFPMVRANLATGWSFSHDFLHFGIGAATAIQSVDVVWPSGKTQKIENPEIDKVLTVNEP